MPMNKSVEDILKILYPDTIQMNETEHKKYEKDKNFLLEFFDEFIQEYNEHFDSIDEYGEYEFTSIILQMCKEKFDKETIIVNYVESLYNALNKNAYISGDFEAFMDLMYFEREQEESFQSQELDMTPISLEEIYSLTEEFLSQIDESQELVKEFRRIINNGRIIVLSPNDTNDKSKYNSRDGVINCVFDGTVNTAKTLLHEFMHHFVEITSHPDYSRENITIFNEFESIYYENAFIKFMNSKGLLKNGESPLKAERLQYAYSEDPENCLIMLLELCQNMKNNMALDKKSIISVLKKYFPDITSEEELWEKESKLLSQFCKDNYFKSEIVTGPVMYRLCTGLAMKTNYELSTMRNIFKLSPFIKDRKHDNLFMEQYNLLVKRCERETITPQVAVKGALRSGITMSETEYAMRVDSTLQKGEPTHGK